MAVRLMELGCDRVGAMDDFNIGGRERQKRVYTEAGLGAVSGGRYNITAWG
jgi:hypothetical protein